MDKPMGNKKPGIFKLAEERAWYKRKELESLIPYLPKDCVSDILTRIPVESLQCMRFVCKPWYNIINSSIFIDAHLRRSETLLIFLTPVLKPLSKLFPMVSIPQEKPNTFSVEANFFQSESVPIFKQPPIRPDKKYYIQFLEIQDGRSRKGDFNASCMGSIIATCNGLILLENKCKRGGAIVMNPVTRKMLIVPVGTLCRHFNESYGLALTSLTREYKLVHLFRDEEGFVGCEILNLRTRSWKEVNGPSVGLFGWFGYKPVSAIGALHWIPKFDHSDYLVSMGMDDEKFYTIPLPKSCRTHDRVVEVGGYLCFATHEDVQMDIWVLKEVCGGNWIKQCSIMTGYIMDLVPLFGSRMDYEMFFEREEDRSLYSYDFHGQVMRKVEMPDGCFPLSVSYQPHVNSLVSWCAEESSEDF